MAIHRHVHVQLHFTDGDCYVMLTRRWIERGQNRFSLIWEGSGSTMGATEGPVAVAMVLNDLAEQLLDVYHAPPTEEAPEPPRGGYGGDVPLPGLSLVGLPVSRLHGGLDDLDFTL